MVFSGDGDHEILGMVDDGSFGKFILYMCKINPKFKKACLIFKYSSIYVLCKYVYIIIFCLYFFYYP